MSAAALAASAAVLVANWLRKGSRGTDAVLKLPTADAAFSVSPCPAPMQVAAPFNIPPTPAGCQLPYCTIWRMNKDGSGAEVYAAGARSLCFRTAACGNRSFGAVQHGRLPFAVAAAATVEPWSAHASLPAAHRAAPSPPPPAATRTTTRHHHLPHVQASATQRASSSTPPAATCCSAAWSATTWATIR